MADHETSVSPAERPALLPAASSLQPTHITSHLPPLKSLQSHNHSASRDRSPFRRRKDITPPSEKPPAQPAYKHRGLPNTNTLQTFLTVTDVPHFGHAAHYNTHHHFHRHDSGDGPAHSADPGHGWRVRKTPIFSGLLAPFSIVLEVPGLTSKWYAKIDADGIVERYIDNPPILTVGLAISLSAAVVANAGDHLSISRVLEAKERVLPLLLLGLSFTTSSMSSLWLYLVVSMDPNMTVLALVPVTGWSALPPSRQRSSPSA